MIQIVVQVLSISYGHSELNVTDLRLDQQIKGYDSKAI